MLGKMLVAMAGLVFARIGLIAGSYGNYTSTDEGIYTDGSTLLSLIVMLVLALVLVLIKRQLSDRTVEVLGICCFVSEALFLCIKIPMALMGWEDTLAQFLIGTALMLSASGSMFYWLRLARGASSTAAVTYTFGALALSEIPLWLFTLIPAPVFLALCAVCALLQLVCMRIVQGRMQSEDGWDLLGSTNDSAVCDACAKTSSEKSEALPTVDEGSELEGYFGRSRAGMQDRYFLVATAIAIGVVGALSGLLRGYPDGLPIPFTPWTRFAYAMLTVILCAAVITMKRSGRPFTMSIVIWTMIEVVAGLALVAYVAFPAHWEIGAVFATTLNALMVAMVWYTVIAFETHGWRDPYYYGLGGWIVWLGCRSIARLSLLEVSHFYVGDPLVGSIMWMFLLMSSLIIFSGYMHGMTIPAEIVSAPASEASDDAGVPDQPAAQPELKLGKIMGLDNENSLANARQEAMRKSVSQMGEQFLLSDREIEVLTLYALGYTQKRVAETLFISQGTAHTHIKRIYNKTGMHSRQDILDYIETYTT